VDNDRALKNAFRRALDDVLPPVPWLEAAVTEDLRARSGRRSVDGNPSKTQPRRMAWPGPAIQLAAGVLILVLTAAAVVTFLELRYSAPWSAPAGAITSPSPSPPRGGPVPAQLDGAWKQVADPTVVMILTGTDFSSAGPAGSSAGKVAVNGSEIDFYNGTRCTIALPGGIGKYRWTISAGLLIFSPLNSDPCPRAPYLANPNGWQRPPP
jgi:hypothetical protein